MGYGTWVSDCVQRDLTIGNPRVIFLIRNTQMAQRTWREQFEVDRAKNLVVLLVTDMGGCNYTGLSARAEVQEFQDRLPEIVDKLVTEGKLIRLRFEVPGYGDTEFLLPAGSVEMLGWK